MTRRRMLPILATVAAAAATLAVTLAEVEPALRAAVVIPFVLVVPGLSLVRLARVRNPLLLASLAVAVSVSLATLVPVVFLYAGFWSPSAVIAVLAGVSVAAPAVDAALTAARGEPSGP